MKLSLSLFAFASADVCQDCDVALANFNAWHGNSDITCTRYTDPRESLSARGACKECKIQCLPSEDKCPGVSAVAHAAWNKTAKKLTAQYLEKYEKSLAEGKARMVARNLEKELEKYEKQKKKAEEKAEKAANKQQKKEDWQAWREEKRAENEAKRAERKQEKKERKAAAKEAKELRKQQRLEKRALAEKNKAKFAFYASLELYYEPICADLHLIDADENVSTRMMNQYEQIKEELVESQ
ncbi:Oidioi.mRNA.OKI2018_I69.XSR.g16510.t1.cds [Oikopleura dioica]|uniref:Oidioi.mRNA.OKI2018_I69.XSR.g16510.t1.cds n=1 Tax=Oikopleura dioica TaxID=34765 RepID=A0ABN7SGT2_OIKDI|nr:Oidioi.mRNA.OKI2018_I69.XSR.g16510.t1.cds [Oikopleura dioica]